jgi:fructose-1,6-bisphosphatase/inositol monophosphatase family enzyme
VESIAPDDRPDGNKAVVGTTDVEVALVAAAAGAAGVRRLYGTDLARVEKSATDFATEADLASEEAIREVIAAARPEDSFEGEETGETVGSRDRRWLVDPLCGTLNFAAGTPLAAVNVALVTPDGVTAAVSADPISGEQFWTDGRGAWVRRTGEDRTAVPSARSLTVDVNCDGKGDGEFLGAQLIVDPAFRAVFAPRAISSTLAVAWVADGRRAGYVTDGNLAGSVHFAAGIALCQTAGCVVTDLAGGPLHTGRGMIAAADEETHACLRALAAPHLARLGRQPGNGTGAR